MIRLGKLTKFETLAALHVMAVGVQNCVLCKAFAMVKAQQSESAVLGCRWSKQFDDGPCSFAAHSSSIFGHRVVIVISYRCLSPDPKMSNTTCFFWEYVMKLLYGKCRVN